MCGSVILIRIRSGQLIEQFTAVSTSVIPEFVFLKQQGFLGQNLHFDL